MEVTILKETEAEEMYDDMLDDCNEGVFNIFPSEILFKCDPIAYDCGFTDYLDSLRQDGYLYDVDDEEGKDYFICPDCDTAFDDEEEAKECCGVEE